MSPLRRLKRIGAQKQKPRKTKAQKSKRLEFGSSLFAAFAALLSWFFPELGRSSGSNLVFMGWVDNAVRRSCHAIFSGISGHPG
jgi:hypothetical protein